MKRVLVEFVFERRCPKCERKLVLNGETGRVDCPEKTCDYTEGGG